METHLSFPYLKEVLIFLAYAGLAIPFLQRLRVSPVLGFLMVGALIGPYGLGVWADQHRWLEHIVITNHYGVRLMADLGVILLLFIIGLELTLERLMVMRRWVLGVGGLQVLLSAPVIGGIAYGFGNSAKTSVILGVCLALSSTAVVTQTLLERNEFTTPLGQASFAVLLAQDLIVVPLLVLLPIMGPNMNEGLAWILMTALGKAALAIAAIFLVGRGVLRPLFHHAAAVRQPDAFMALTLLCVLGTSVITFSAGLSMALGAFLSGLLIAETEYRHEVEIIIQPFKGLLLGLFFMSVGMGIDLLALRENTLWILGSVLGLFCIKGLVVAALFRAYGLTLGTAVEGGLLLGQGGEFAFIVVGAAMAQELLNREVGQFMLLVVALGMMLSPPFARLGQAAGRFLDTRLAPRGRRRPIADAPAIEGHVVIAGFGRVGQMLGRILDEQRIPYVALDHNSQIVNQFYAQKRPVYYGDASRMELLQHAHADKARAIVVTMDQVAAVQQAVKAIRRHNPQIPIFVRAKDEQHAFVLKRIGATQVVPEALEASLQLAGYVLEELGIPHEASTLVIDQHRRGELHALEPEER